MDDDATPARGRAAPRGAPDDQRIGRIRRAMLERIAHASTGQHLTVRAGSRGWQPFLEGVRIKLLHEQGDAPAVSYLLQLAPGAVVPSHRHPIDEECLVLEGELRIGDTLVLQSGDYHCARAGYLHAPTVAPDGALVFLRGAAPCPSHLI